MTAPHDLRPSCGPFGTRCGFDHSPVELCPTCREALATWCICPPQEKAMTAPMKTILMNVNARNGTVAEGITSSFLKDQLRDPQSPPRRAGFVQFDIEGWDRPGPDLPDAEAVLVEVTKRRPLPTYRVHVTLYRERV